MKRQLTGITTLLNIERKVFLGRNDLKENAKQVFKRNFSETIHVKKPHLHEPNNEISRLGLVRKISPHVTNTSVITLGIFSINLIER